MCIVYGARAVSKLLGGGGLVAGAIGLMSLVAHTTVFFESLHHYKEALDLYTNYVRLPLLQAAGLTEVPALAIDVAVVWLALFAAINAFVFRADGNFLWGHIGHNYCFQSKQTWLGKVQCRLPKFIWAFLMTPIVCILAGASNLLTGRTYFTMAYITLQTTAVAKYFAGLFAISALALAALALVPSAIALPN